MVKFLAEHRPKLMLEPFLAILLHNTPMITRMCCKHKYRSFFIFCKKIS